MEKAQRPYDRDVDELTFRLKEACGGRAGAFALVVRVPTEEGVEFRQYWRLGATTADVMRMVGAMECLKLELLTELRDAETVAEAEEEDDDGEEE